MSFSEKIEDTLNMKLISMVAFTLEKEPEIENLFRVAKFVSRKVFRYATFLNMPLKPWVFTNGGYVSGVLINERDSGDIFYLDPADNTTMFIYRGSFDVPYFCVAGAEGVKLKRVEDLVRFNLDISGIMLTLLKE